jgi:competence protein ComEA
MSGERGSIFPLLLMIVAVIGGGVLLLTTRPEPVQITIHPPRPTATIEQIAPTPLIVFVTGAVNQPATTIELPAGSRVQDAIDAAGGVTQTADIERVNLAGILRDGDQIHVPSRDETVVLPTPGGGMVIYINTATYEELQTLPGIGPSLAEIIIAHRESNGAFADFEALDAVPGIGPALLERLRGLISFE